MTPTPQCNEACLAKLRGQQHEPLEKIVAAAPYAKKTRQLGHRDGQGRAGFEADEDTVADQFHQPAEPQQPGNEAEERYNETREAGDLRIVNRVSRRHGPDRAGNHQRDRGGGSDRELA